MTAVGVSYNVLSGQGVHGGRNRPLPPPAAFDSIALTDGADVPWSAQNGRPFVVNLHGSSGSNSSNGRQYRAQVGGPLAFEGFTEFGFSIVPGYRTINGATVYHLLLRPIDKWTYNGTNRESMHVGFKRAADGRVYLTTERRYDAMIAWAGTNLTQYDHNARVCEGGSMGGWGTISYAVRRHAMFAALYPDRPRWRYGYNVGEVAVSTLENGWSAATVANSPRLADADGGTSYAAHLDLIAYISNPANKVRPILWCCGRNDGYVPFSEQIAAVDALRATGRMFAFAWNDGNHSTGSIMSQLLASYPYGTFLRDRGYPVFTEHSLDQDPKVDLTGGINIGLSFRNVTENGIRWSCEVTNISSACTVKVKPWSEKFAADVAPKLVTIPAAGTWVAVEFNA